MLGRLAKLSRFLLGANIILTPGHVFQAANEEKEIREREKKEKRVYGNWRRLIRGLLIRERINTAYFGNLDDQDSATVAAEGSSTATTEKVPAKEPTSRKRKK